MRTFQKISYFNTWAQFIPGLILVRDTQGRICPFILQKYIVQIYSSFIQFRIFQDSERCRNITDYRFKSHSTQKSFE